MNAEKEQVRFLAQVMSRISQGQNFDDIFDSLYRGLKGILPCDRMALGFLHADGHTLIVGPVRSRRKILLGTGYRESIPARHCARLLALDKTRVLSDLPEHLRAHPQSKATYLLVKEGLKSSLTLPLHIGGEPAGILWFSSRQRGAYTAQHEAFMRTLAGQLALILEKARLIGKVAAGAQVKTRLQEENERLRALIDHAPAVPELIGASPPWRKMLQRLELVAATDATVLIRGETGTGKELIARAIHRLSSRKEKPFVAVNCGAFTEELIAGELFGHERGAFTGALQRKLGRLDLAQGGTLFLDEVAELSSGMQVKLLRVLQEREFERVGGTQTMRTDIRVIAATHRNLDKERAEGRFRDDLFYRLNVFPIHVPPLRERKEDIEPLLRFFLIRYSQKLNKTFDGIDPQALSQCQYYHWPGNVRELENLVERSVILGAGPALQMDPLAESASHAPEGDALALDAVVKRHLVKVLRMTGGKIYGSDGAALALGLKPSTLQAKMRKLGIRRQPLREFE